MGRREHVLPSFELCFQLLGEQPTGGSVMTCLQIALIVSYVQRKKRAGRGVVQKE